MQVKCKYKVLKVNRIIIYDCGTYSRAHIEADIDNETADKAKKTKDKSIEIYTDNGERLFDGMIENDMVSKTEHGCRLVINASTGFNLSYEAKCAVKRNMEKEIDLSNCRTVADEKGDVVSGYNLVNTDFVRVGDAVTFRGKRFCVTRSVIRYKADSGKPLCDCRIEPI